MTSHDPYLAAAKIVQDAGGELVGRTRLQKIAFLLNLAGFSDEFSFEYRHYGPYSEDLAQAMEIAAILGPINEEEKTADWGGRYSIYRVDDSVEESDPKRTAFVTHASKIDAVELELAATAAYLFSVEKIGENGNGNPWDETKRRKPSKATDVRLKKAAKAYDELRKLNTEKPLEKLPAPL